MAATANKIHDMMLSNTLNLTRFRVHLLWHYSSIAKITNFVTTGVSKHLRLETSHGMPHKFFIDTVNACNLRCPLCPTGLKALGRDTSKMSFEHFRTIVDQIAKYAYVMELYNWGEPFLHPQIFDMVSYAHKRKICTRISSNMNVFNKDMARKAVESGLDRLMVSVDGSTQEVYEKYRRRGKLEKVVNNVRLLIEAKQRLGSRYPFVLFRMLTNRHNEHQFKELAHIAKELGVDALTTAPLMIDVNSQEQVKEWLPTDESQSRYDYSDEKLENTVHCGEYLWSMMIINSDGAVSPCCWIHQKKHDFENALEKSVKSIWNGEDYVSARRVFSPWQRWEPKAGPKENICTKCRGQPYYLKD